MGSHEKLSHKTAARHTGDRTNEGNEGGAQ